MANENDRLGVINETLNVNLDNLSDLLNQMHESYKTFLSDYNYSVNLALYTNDYDLIDSMSASRPSLKSIGDTLSSAIAVLDMVKDGAKDFHDELTAQGVDLSYEQQNSWKSFAQFIEEDGGVRPTSIEDYQNLQDKYQQALECEFSEPNTDIEPELVDDTQNGPNEELGSDITLV